MSISVDESGIPTPHSLTHALAGFRRAAENSGVHPAYKRALRYGTPGSHHNITICGRAVTIIVAQQPHQPATPAREHASWLELREAVTGLLNTATGHNVTAMLPTEVAAAIWEHDGREVRAYHPEAASVLRRARSQLRRRLGALSPLPLLGGLTQPLAGSATAVGIAIAPVMPPMDTPPPAPAVVEILGGDIARPEPPHTPGLYLATPSTRSLGPLIPQPRDQAFAADTNPTPPASDPSPVAATPAATPTPDVSSPTPTASPVPEVDSTTGPSPAIPDMDPTSAPLDTPDDPPISSPTISISVSPTSSHTPRRHGHGHRHGKHQRHPSHRRH